MPHFYWFLNQWSDSTSGPFWGVLALLALMMLPIWVMKMSASKHSSSENTKDPLLSTPRYKYSPSFIPHVFLQLVHLQRFWNQFSRVVIRSALDYVCFQFQLAPPVLQIKQGCTHMVFCDYSMYLQVMRWFSPLFCTLQCLIWSLWSLERMSPPLCSQKRAAFEPWNSTSINAALRKTQLLFLGCKAD